MEHMLKQSDQERRGFAGSGLGLDGHVLALQSYSKGLFLDGRHFFISSVRDSMQEPGLDFQFIKIHYITFLFE
ncbi:MAG: hypothetical protein U9O50_06915 [Acidobacteriota bacterium]|nr:hypothetical protein [Acidobacteriota bacterium]